MSSDITYAVACLSVTVTFVYCIQKAEDIVKLLSRPGSPVILAFDSIRAPIPNSKDNPFIGRYKYTGWGNSRSSTEIAVYVRWNINRKS